MIRKEGKNKFLAGIASVFFLTNVILGGMQVNVLKVKAEAETETAVFKFDFGDGAVKNGYTQVKSTSQYTSDQKFGFTDISKVTAGTTTDEDAVKGDYLISNGTTFNVDLQPGDYRVNVILGDTTSATTVDVGAERKFGKDITGADTYLLNMMKLTGVQASAGEFLQKTFTISLIDNQLNLDFVGEAAKINGIEIYKLPARSAGVVPTVYITSDSTVQTYADSWKPQAGWGQMLSRYFSDGVKIDNRAIGGRSSRSFISEGRLDAILNEIKPGDYIFVQWGHNDATTTRPERYVSETDFPTYIKMYIDGVRQRGAIPVLISPVARRSFNATTGIFNISFGGYRQKMMDTAQSENAAFIDLGLKSKNFLDAFGVEGSTSIFLHVPAGIYSAFPNGSADDTHFQEFGAIQMAKLVSEGVKEAKLPIAQYLKNIEPPASVPAAPQTLTTGKIGSSSIAMSWNTVEGADIYYIYRQKVGDTEFKKAGTSTVTQFTDVNAAQQTSYNYYVVAVNGKGESAASNTVTATTKAPGYRFDFGPNSDNVQAGFTAVPQNMEYTAERGYGLSPAPNNGRDRGVVTGYNDLQRDFILGKTQFLLDVPNGDYSVKITVADATGTAANTLTVEGKSLGKVTGKLVEKLVEARVLDGQLTIDSDGWLNGIEVTAILLAPTGLRSYEKILDANAPSVVLAWMPVEDAASYNLYRKSDTDAEFVKIANVPASGETKYYEQNVNLGSSYEYKVTALTSDGYESAATNIEKVVMVDPNAAIPNPPTGLSAVNLTKNSATIKWGAANGAVLYNIYRSKSENGTYNKVGSAKDLQFTDNTVTTNINYYYKIQAVSAGGPSTLSQALKTDITQSLSRQTENITDRALIAMKSSDGVYLSWRSLKNDLKDMTFNVFRDGKQINVAPISKSTNYVDPSGTLSSTYYIVPVVSGTAQAQSKTVNVLANNYFDIKINRPASGVTPLNEEYTYDANDSSVGDLDGDGENEIVVKWAPSRSKDNSQGGYTGETILDAYKMDGTQLWRINLGKNIRSGAHYNPFMVYDLDGDGKAEVVVKTADGTVDGQGTVIGDASADYRNPSGYVLTGPEFLTVFNGKTGAAMDTINYKPERGRVDDWGDAYGNRVDRFLGCVAYLNGETPSVVMSRGYYTRAVLVAYDLVNGKLVERWTIDSNDPKNSALAGQGNHNLAVGDVDGDQMDEIIYGGAAIDNDGTLLYSTGLGHGDASHMSDLDPTRPGLEYYQVHEEGPNIAGMEMRNVATGELLWGVPSKGDVGRGVAADIDPRYLGSEAWAIKGGGAWDSNNGGLYNVKGEKLSDNIPSANFSIYWDGDLLRELADHTWDGVKGVGKIDKWDFENNKLVNLLTATGTNSNNSTKGNPCLQADLFGDWREEIIWRTEDNSALRVYSTTIPTDYKFTTLMQDPVYRLSVAWQNVGYNQPPQVGFYLGDNSTPVDLKVTAATSNSVTLDWSDVLAGAQSYNIYRSNTIDGEFVKVGTSTESTYKDTTNEALKEYFYKVTSVVNEKESYASLKVNVTTPLGVKSIKPLAGIEVIKGSTTLGLPSQVTAIGNDDKELQVAVTWDITGVDLGTVGTYKAVGTVLGYEGKIEVAVTVKDNYVVGIKEIIPVKSVVNVNPTLPSKVTLVFANKTEQEVAVTWDISTLNIKAIGTYTLEGTITGFTEKAKLTVNVVANYITSIKAVADVMTVEGTAPILPGKITAVYADTKTAEVPVTWTTVDTSKHGNYTAEGTVAGYDSKITANVIVYDKPLYMFDFGGVSTKYGNGKVEPGFTEVDASLKYSAGKGYGFSDKSSASCINRDAASTNKMYTDYASTYNGFTDFYVDVPNGMYLVKIYSGDLSGKTNTNFKVEDVDFGKLSSSSSIATKENIVTVKDGVLNVNYGYSSGLGALNGLVIIPITFDSVKPLGTFKVLQGEVINLPTTVIAVCHQDGIEKQVPIVWNSLDTSIPGTYNVEGTVKGYANKVAATVQVEALAVPVASLTGTKGKDEWYLSEVGLTATYDSRAARNEYSLDGVNWTAYTAPILLSQDGVNTVSLRSLNKSGIVLTSASVQVKIDKTAPEVQKTEKLSFMQTEAINIPIQAVDATSGIDNIQINFNGQNTTGSAINVDSLSMPVGQYPIVVTAYDKAGNKSEQTLILNITMDIDNLDDLITLGVNKGLIDNKGVANSLFAKVAKIQQDKNVQERLRNSIIAMQQEVTAQYGKHIDAGFAKIILEDLKIVESQPAASKEDSKSDKILKIDIPMDIDNLDELINAGVTQGYINDKGVSNSLLTKAAKIQQDKDVKERLRNSIIAMQQEVTAQSGNHISTEFAKVILEHLKAIETEMNK